MMNIKLNPGKDGKEKAVSIDTPRGEIVIGVHEPYNAPVETNIYFISAAGVSTRVISLAELIAKVS